MSNLIVVGFKKDMYRASTVLNELIGMDLDWVVDLRDAVAVYRDYSGRLRIDQSYQLTTEEGSGWGALWGSPIGGRTCTASLKTLSEISVNWCNRVIQRSLRCCAQPAPPRSPSTSVATAAPSSTHG
jgi:hypothetical protein